MHPVRAEACHRSLEPDSGMNRAFEQVTVISVTYESVAVAASLAQTLQRFLNVIVIDNASRDGTAQALAAQLPHALVVGNQANIGFGPANNQAVAMVKTPYALLLNPDCDISQDALQSLLATAERYPSGAIVAPQGWYAKDLPQPSYRHAFYETRAPQQYRIPDGTCSAKWLHGCCLLVRVDAFRQFGGFDERFFLYYEDDDLCLRALQAGYDCLLEPQAQILHIGGASSTPSWRTEFRKHFYFFRSRHLIIGKYLGRVAARQYRVKTALAAPLASLLYVLLLQRKHALKWLAWGCSAWSTRRQ
jgi:N-acetylglucosaminyl-diphospho-decaprenol L-rhamnosyltransferase